MEAMVDMAAKTGTIRMSMAMEGKTTRMKADTDTATAMVAMDSMDGAEAAMGEAMEANTGENQRRSD